MNQAALRVILIGGPSNVGKSTLARSIAERLGWQCKPTDGMVPYPGRPWGQVRPHVAEHYLALSPDQLIEGAIQHYTRLWPDIRNIIVAHACDASAEHLILEGSALWPESVASLRLDGVAALWLTASDGFLQRRIYAASGYDGATNREREVVDKFLGRVQRYNQRMLHDLRRFGLPWVNVEETASLAELIDSALQSVDQKVSPASLDDGR